MSAFDRPPMTALEVALAEQIFDLLKDRSVRTNKRILKVVQAKLTVVDEINGGEIVP